MNPASPVSAPTRLLPFVPATNTVTRYYWLSFRLLHPDPREKKKKRDSTTNLGPFRICSVGSRIIPRSSIVLPSQRTDGPVGVFVELQPFFHFGLPPSILLFLVLFVVLSVVGGLSVVLPAFASPPRRDRRGSRGHNSGGVRRGDRRDRAGRGTGSKYARSRCRRRRGRRARRYRGRRRRIRGLRSRFLSGDTVRELVLADLDFDLVWP